MLSIPIVSQFDGKGLKAALKGFQQLETRGQKAAFILKKAGQAAAVGFAAVGAAALTAGKFMLDFAKIAREDQLAQVQLAGTLKATTKATDAQIAAVEDYIDVTQRATGVADDDLRPSFGRLLRSTKDVGKAQKLLNLALDISGRTGKPLTAVVNGLAKASEGQLGALSKLGLGYDKTELKVKSFKTIQDELTKEYAGGANEKAKTFEGTMARLEITFGELKESLGTYILPFLQQLADSAIKVSDAFGKGGMAKAVEELKFQLQFLLYDADGQLNAVGQQLNTLLTAYNALATTSNVGRYLPTSIIGRGISGQSLIAPEITGMEKLAPSIDINERNRRQRGVTVNQGLGMSNYIRQNPGSVVTVVVPPTADLAAVGKEIKKALNAADRQGGGYGSRAGNR
jgi:hypothetical protein